MWGQPPLQQAQSSHRLSFERSSNALTDTHNHRRPRRTLTRNDRGAPLPQRSDELPQPNLSILLWTPPQVPPRPLHQRTSSHHIPRRMMMQRHRRLNQPLQESPLQPVRLAPHILPNLMRVIKLPRIEVPNPHLIPLPESHLLILRLDRMNARGSDAGSCGAGALARDCRRKRQQPRREGLNRQRKTNRAEEIFPRRAPQKLPTAA